MIGYDAEARAPRVNGMRKAALVAIALLVYLQGGLGDFAEAAVGVWSPEKSRMVDREMQRLLEREARRGKGGARTVSVTIGINGRLVHADGYGLTLQERKATADTRYALGSLSKQITAAAVLRAITRGAVSRRMQEPITLDTDIRDVFHDVDHWLRDDRVPIRIRNLLTMTSNLPNFTRRPPALTDPWGSIEAPRLLSELKRYRPHGWPNTFEYNNTGYFLLAELLDQTCDPGACANESSRFDAAIASTLKDAGMTATSVANQLVPTTDRAPPGYRGKPAFLTGYWLKGSADLAGTAHDMHRWNVALMSGRVVRAEMRELMFADAARVSPEVYYGMGWFIEHGPDRDIFSHTGSVPGYTSINLIARTQPRSDRWIGITILTNGEEVDDIDVLAKDLLRIVDQE